MTINIAQVAQVYSIQYNTLSSLPSTAPTVIVMEDMNFPRTWRSSEDGLLVPVVAGHRDDEVESRIASSFGLSYFGDE